MNVRANFSKNQHRIGVWRFAALILSFCFGLSVLAHDDGPLYTAHNIWFEHPLKIHSINYKSGAMIPAGTEIKEVKMVGTPYIVNPRAKCWIHFWTLDGRKYTIHFKAKFHPGMSLEDFKKATFTHTPLDVRTKDFSENEINAIKRGILVEGMSKEAVLIAYGPPPGHFTVSLEANCWRYWIKRVKTKDIFFHDGKTTTRPVRHAL